MITVNEINNAIESFAPKSLQESYDNAGLQVGNPEMQVSAVMLCLDVTEEILAEAQRRGCNMIISHHPLIFKGLKQLTGADGTQRIVMKALLENIAIYSAHTNLDAASEGVSFEMANMLDLKNPEVLVPKEEGLGLGVVGTIQPTPNLEFLRRVKEIFHVKCLKYSARTSGLVVRKVALCGGSGSSFIQNAITSGADVYITGDLKYHDFTTYGQNIILADIGHYESELCSRRIFSRILREGFPDMPVFMAESDTNPIKFL